MNLICEGAEKFNLSERINFNYWYEEVEKFSIEGPRTRGNRISNALDDSLGVLLGNKKGRVKRDLTL